MSAVPASFDGALALRHQLDTARKEREERLAFLRLLEDLVRQYVRFWHVRICKKPAQDLADYSPVLTPRPVQPGATPSFYVAPFVTDIFLARNRGSGSHLIPASGFLWVDKPVQSSRTAPIKSEMGGPFPLILHDVNPPRSGERSYAAWAAGELSSSGRPWEIDSNAVEGQGGFTLPATVTRVIWCFEGGAAPFENATNPAWGRAMVLEHAPRFATTHLLAIYRAGSIHRFEFVFDHPPHHAQARREGEAAHVLGKSSVRRRH